MPRRPKCALLLMLLHDRKIVYQIKHVLKSNLFPKEPFLLRFLFKKTFVALLRASTFRVFFMWLCTPVARHIIDCVHTIYIIYYGY